MIESEVKKQRIKEVVIRWCEFTKIMPYLRKHDIPALVSQVMNEFYNITFCCGHMGNLNDGVHIRFYTYEGRTDDITEGSYCKDCAEKYVKELGAEII